MSTTFMSACFNNDKTKVGDILVQLIVSKIHNLQFDLMGS